MAIDIRKIERKFWGFTEREMYLLNCKNLNGQILIPIGEKGVKMLFLLTSIKRVIDKTHLTKF